MPETAEMNIQAYVDLRRQFDLAVFAFDGSRKKTDQLLEIGAQLESLIYTFAKASRINDLTTAEAKLAQDQKVSFEFAFQDGLNKAITHLTETFANTYKQSGGE
jgi:hypothetical protein